MRLIVLLLCACCTYPAALQHLTPREHLALACDPEADSNERQRSWQALIELDEPPADLLPPLLQAVRTSDPRRIGTGSMLTLVGHYGAEAAAILPTLQDWLAIDGVRNLIDCLVAIGEPAIAPTLATLADEELPLPARRRAIQALLHLGAGDRLDRWRDDPDPHIAGAIAVAATVDRLPRIADDGDLTGWLWDRHVDDALIPFLARPGAIRSDTVMRVIGRIPYVAPAHQATLLQALVGVPPPEQLLTIEVARLCGSPSAAVRRAARAALTSLDPGRRAAIAALEQDWPASLVQVAMTPEHGPVELADDLRSLLEDPATDAAVAVAALGRLEACLPAVRMPVLIALVETAPDSVARPAAEALRRCVGLIETVPDWRRSAWLKPIRDGAPSLIATIAKRDDPAIAQALLDAMVRAEIRDADAEPIVGILDDPARHALVATCFAFCGQTRSAAALPAARAQRDHPDPDRAASAATAYRQIMATRLDDPDALLAALADPDLADAALERILGEKRFRVTAAHVAAIRPMLQQASLPAGSLRRACQVIGRGKALPQDLAKDLVALLRYPDEGVLLAAAGLVRRCPGAGPELVSALVGRLGEAGRTPEATAELLEVVTALSPSGRHHAPQLLPLCSHPDDRVARAALFALCADGDRSAATTARQRYDRRPGRRRTGDAYLTIMTTGHLARSHADCSALLYERLQTATDRDQREYAVYGLKASRRRDAATLDVLISALRDPDRMVRYRVVQSLGDWGSAAARAVPALRQAIADDLIDDNQGGRCIGAIRKALRRDRSAIMVDPENPRPAPLPEQPGPAAVSTTADGF